MADSVTGVDQVLANLDRVLERLQAGAERAVAAIVELLVEDAKSDHAYTDRTGNLTASIRGAVVEVSVNAVRMAVFAEADYAGIVETMAAGEYAFLLPAIERNRGRIVEILRREMSL